jgi:RNA-directed DNA polymerase
MPKRIGYLYEKLLDKNFIMESIYESSLNKRNRREVRQVLCNINKYTDKMIKLLETNSFVPAKLKSKIIWDASSQKKS